MRDYVIRDRQVGLPDTSTDYLHGTATYTASDVIKTCEKLKKIFTSSSEYVPIQNRKIKEKESDIVSVK